MHSATSFFLFNLMHPHANVVVYRKGKPYISTKKPQGSF